MIRKKISAVILAVILLIFGEETAFAAGIRDAVRFPADDQPVYFEMTVELEKLPQFDERRTELLNRILRHLTFKGLLQGRTDSMTVLLDNTELFSVSRTDIDGSSRETLTQDTDHMFILPSDDSAGTEKELKILNSLKQITDQKKIYFSLEPFAAFFERLPDLFPEQCGSAKILEKYKDYGTAVKKVSIRLDGDVLAACVREYAGAALKEPYMPDLRQIVFSGRQDIELLLTEEGKALKIRYGGNAGFSAEDLRTVRLEWKTVRNDTVEKDELTLRTPNKNATRRNNILLEHIWRKKEDKRESFSWKVETDDLADGIRTRGIIQCTAESEGSSVTGSFVKTVTVKSRRTDDEIQFSFSGNPEDQYSGILEIISKTDTIETGQLKTDFSFSRNGHVPDGPETIRPVYLSEAEYSKIRHDLFSKILQALFTLPPEDLLFLTEGIPEETLNTLVRENESVKEPVQ